MSSVETQHPNAPLTPEGRTSNGCLCARSALRRKQRWGADRMAHVTRRAPSTVQAILNAAGLGRLDSDDRATREPVVRYQRESPGELIHVNVKKLAAILTTAYPGFIHFYNHH